jgi:hypothetical protein
MKKRKITLIIIILCGLTSMSAQTPLREQVALGARIGGVGSFVSFSPTISTNLKFGMQGGVACRYIAEKYFGVQAEINYVQRGWKEDYPEQYNYQRTLHYLEIPFMTHIWFGKKSFRWFFNIGPEIAFLLADNAQTDIADENLQAQHGDISNRFDYGICAGTGFEFQTKAGIYQLEARYDFGLSDMFPNTASDEFRKSSNQNVSLSFGVLFNLLK